MLFTIPDDELVLRASRSSGPGGQHVNTSATKVEARWSVRDSPSLSEDDRTWLLERLAGRLDRAGVLRVVASEHRSQLQNRAAAVRRLREVVAEALVRPRRRRKTKPPKSAAQARLASKRRRADVKRRRGSVEPDD
ncbi:MAG: aminoacyl-tRNA hydrolase [Gemmatimonadales bacterium]|jgi:ribosome-associated protein|nr:aminoacyl-tRNA hydrolase [Gemmatimonadales bacterium]